MTGYIFKYRLLNERTLSTIDSYILHRLQSSTILSTVIYAPQPREVTRISTGFLALRFSRSAQLNKKNCTVNFGTWTRGQIVRRIGGIPQSWSIPVLGAMIRYSNWYLESITNFGHDHCKMAKHCEPQ